MEYLVLINISLFPSIHYFAKSALSQRAVKETQKKKDFNRNA